LTADVSKLNVQLVTYRNSQER